MRKIQTYRKNKPKILFCGDLRSPFISQDFELLNKHYLVEIVKLDDVQTKKGFIIYIWIAIIKTIIKLIDSDIIYIWFVDYPTFPLLFLSKIFGKKSIIIVGGWEVAAYPEISYGNQLYLCRGAVTRWCLRNSDIVIVPSQAYKNITKLVEPTSNICIVPNAIDKLLCEHSLPIKHDTVVTALFTLKYSVLKGILTFKAASEKLPYEFIIYDGIPHNILMDKLRMSKVYCQLSYTESFGMTNLEAMACGCVPVVTNRDALPEIIGNTGLVVPYGDVDATIKAIQIAMTMNGNNARERSKLFIHENRFKILSDILENNYKEIPLISIVIPSYNCAQWISYTIQSIIDQTYKNIEIIVVDDCSTDNTHEIVLKFDNVKYIKNSINMGECITSRRGFDESRGDYICRLSADDMYANVNKIKNQVDMMEMTGADWSYNSINCSGENLESSKIIKSSWVLVPSQYICNILQLFDNVILKFPYFAFIILFFRNPVNSSTLMFRRSSYMKSVKWSSGKRRTDCDGLLLYNLFLDRSKCISIRELGSFYRTHPNQMSYNPKYINDMRENKLEVINKVLNGNYPFWLKFIVKIIGKYI